MYRRSGRKRKPTSLATTVGKRPRAAPRSSVAATVHSATSTSTVLPPCQQSIQSPFATVAMPLTSPMPVTYPVIPVTTSPIPVTYPVIPVSTSPIPVTTSPIPITYPVIPVTTTSQVSQTAIFTTSSNPTVPVLSASSAVLGNSLSQEPHDITLANTLFEQAPSQILSIHSDIGIHVPHNIKEKIQRSEYIDLCTLLSNNPNKKKTQKLSLGRKSNNDDAVTGASKQLKSSSIDDVEIVHASPVSKAVRVKPNVRCCDYTEGFYDHESSYS